MHQDRSGIQSNYATVGTKPPEIVPDANTRLLIKTNSPEPLPTIKLYRWRWVVLVIFSLNNTVTNYLWIMSSAVADVMLCYYNITDTMLNLLSTSYMMVYIVMVLPAVWMMNNCGLKLPSVLASGFMTLGAALRIAGSGSNYYWIILIGQFTAAISNSIFFGGGPVLSEIWFPSSERATATAISGAIAPQIGILLALGLTPLIIHSPLTAEVCNASVATNSSIVNAWNDLIYERIFYYQCAVASVAMLTFLFTIFAFYEAPPTPPSLSRKLEKDHKDANFSNQLKTFLLSFKNVYFLLFLFTSGILLAAAGALVSIINEIVQPKFGADKDTQIGYLGLSTEASAIISMLLVGRILDWTKQFYLMSVGLAVLGAGSTAALVIIVMYQHNFYLLYLGVVLVGATLPSFQAVAYEYVIEMTYPLPEATSAGMVNLVSQIISIAMILLVSPSRYQMAMWFLVGTTASAALVAVFTKPKLRRNAIDEQQNR